MQKKKKIVLSLLVVMVLLLIILNSKKEKVNSEISTVEDAVVEPKQISVSGYEIQVNSDEGIEVSAEPKKISNDGENIFSVEMNNHVIDLDYDFAKISSLTDDKGNVYSATEWRGESSGHHVSGELIFSEIKSETKSLELKIEGIADADRIFEWEIK